MSKNLVSIIVFLLLLVIFINGFSASYTSRKIDNLAYVLALGIDVGEKADLKVSAQFTKSASVSPGSGTSAEDIDNIVLVSGEADSIFSAINLLNSYIGKEINLSHCSLIIFSEEFAKQGIATEIYSLINNEEVRPTCNLIVSKSTAYDYLNNSNPNLEKLTTQYYETFAITGRFTGYFSNITIGDFYNNLSAKYCDSTAILGGLNSTARQKDSEKSNQNSGGGSGGGSSGSSNSGSGGSSSGSSSSGGGSSSGSSSSQTINETNAKQDSENQEDVVTNPEDLIAGTSSIVGDRGTENFGIAVFKDDKLCGELTATESICHLLIDNKVDSCIISIDNPISENETKKLELQLFPSKKSKVDLKIKEDKPHISIQIALDADIMTLDKDVDYETDKVLSKLSDATKEYLEEEFNKYLDKVTKEYEVDIDDFCLKGPAHFSTISEWKNFNWDEKFKDAKFDVNIDINVLSTILITKTWNKRDGP